MSVETSGQKGPVLLVGSDPEILGETRRSLAERGIVTAAALTDTRAVPSFLEQQDVSLVILDMDRNMAGTGLLPRICKGFPHIPVLVETASTSAEHAVECMKSGAADYLVRPVEPRRLFATVENLLSMYYSRQESRALKDYLLNDRLKLSDAFSEIKTVSRKMRSVFQYTEVVARSPQPVLITGETGVGKELFARAIHRISRVRGQFVSINVAGLDDAMFSDTLFGHRKGAFTGADQNRDGLVSRAASGTLFLDEIGDLNELSQVKLLRLLQEREFYPVGSDFIKTSTARIVLATNADLLERIKEGRFRRDLYYRLCTHHIHIPPLRERKEDIPILLDSFIAEASDKFCKNAPVPSHTLIQALSDYDFPGNIREMQARVRDAVARNGGGVLAIDDFAGIPVETQCPPLPCERPDGFHAGIYNIFGRLPTFHEVEDFLILEALKISDGNYASAAAILGVTRQTISKRLKSINSAPSI